MGHATPWEAATDKPHLVVALVLLLVLQWYIVNRFVVKDVALYPYQHQFLERLGGTGGASAGLQMIITRALADPRTHTAIFDSVHCCHCASVNPAEWIASAKGAKQRYPLELPFSSQTFLKRKLIGEVYEAGSSSGFV